MKLPATLALIVIAAAITGQCTRPGPGLDLDTAADRKRPPAVRCGPRERPQVPATPAEPLPVTLRDVFFPR